MDQTTPPRKSSTHRLSDTVNGDVEHTESSDGRARFDLQREEEEEGSEEETSHPDVSQSRAGSVADFIWLYPTSTEPS